MKYIPLTDVRYLVVHCAATSENVDVGVKEIDRWHRERGFFSIGYHAVIRRDGRREYGRPLDQPGAHVGIKGYNAVSRGVCVVGGVEGVDKNKDGRITPDEFVPESNFTEAQMVDLADLLHEWSAEFPDAKIVGHRDLDNRKACPSFDVAAWVAGGMVGVPPTLK